MSIIKIERNGYTFQIDPERPFTRFKLGGGGGKPKAPPPIAQAPTPRQIDEEVRIKDNARRKQRIAAAGRGGTILTSGQSLASGSATLLGRSTG